MERINIDNEPPSRIKRLHPTLKKCACGFVGSKHLFLQHMDVMLMSARSGGEDAKVFWQKHGEVPYNIENNEMVDIDWTK
jgi:hypothetical protein